MLYIDTSVFVAALTNEIRTGSVQAWLADQISGELLVSEWVSTEFSSALSVKLRMGHLEDVHRADALAAYTALVAASFGVLPPLPSDFRLAAHFADRHVLGIRAGDALHLAVASRVGAAVCTLDQRLAAAGPALGVKTQLL